MPHINSSNFERAAARTAGAPFELLGKVMTSAGGYVMPAAKVAGGLYVAHQSVGLGFETIRSRASLFGSGDVANTVLFGALSVSGIIAGGGLATLGVIDAVRETQRLMRKEA